MTDEELIRKLNSVGKQAFVEHFHLFQCYALGDLSQEQTIGELVRRGVSNDAGAAIRASNAKLIFEAKREMKALSIVAASKRLPLPILVVARRLVQ